MSTLFSNSTKTLTAAVIIALAPLANGFAATAPSLSTLLKPSALTVAATVDPTQQIKEQTRKLLDASLPQFTASVLDAKGAGNWNSKVDLNQITTAMADDSVRLVDAVLQSKRLVDDNRALKLDTERGAIRYESRKRAWDINQGPKLRVSTEQAKPIVGKALQILGLPESEFGDLRMNTQMLRLSDKVQDAKNFGSEYEMYRTVHLSRKINGLPVLNSRALATVNNDGLIQRLKVSWTPFSLSPELKIRSRADVLDQAVEAVLQDDPLHVTDDPNVRITAQLAYANNLNNINDNADDRPGNLNAFRPVAIISVLALPTPYQVVVPLAE